MGLLGEENDCMLAKDNLIKNKGRKMLLWKQELLSSFQKGGWGVGATASAEKYSATCEKEYYIFYC